METFGDRLRKLLDERELTQATFAKILNTSDATVNRYIKNVNFPGEDMLNKIADYFNVSVDYLLCRTDNPNYSIISTNYKGNTVDIVVKSKTNNYSQDDIQKLFDRLASIGINVDDIIEK